MSRAFTVTKSSHSTCDDDSPRGARRKKSNRFLLRCASGVSDEIRDGTTPKDGVWIIAEPQRQPNLLHDAKGSM